MALRMGDECVQKAASLATHPILIRNIGGGFNLKKDMAAPIKDGGDDKYIV